MANPDPSLSSAANAAKDTPESKGKPAAGAGEIEHKPPQGARSNGTWRAPDGREIHYECCAEWLVLRRDEKPVAEMFAIAYLQQDVSRRPLTFVFNGGPGASSVYLHLGAAGTRRVSFCADGRLPPPPMRLVDNAESWLSFTDLVFVDPVGTGFSRAIDQGDKQEGAKPGGAPTAGAAGAVGAATSKAGAQEFYGIERDLKALAEFMRRFLARHDRWDSPVFIAGESYGGFRVAKLARMLQADYGIGLSGVLAISPALEFGSLNSTDYQITPWVDRLPVQAAAAVYHGKSAAFARGTPVESVLREAEDFALNDFATLLVQGAAMAPARRAGILERIAGLLGLPIEIVARSEGRVDIETFARELLRSERRVCGIYDASIAGADPFPDRAKFEGPDPTLTAAIELAFAAGINKRIRGEIGVDTEREYCLLNLEANEAWTIDMKRHALEAQIGATDDLRYGMSLNPHLKVLIAHGHYDLVTPYFGSKRLCNLMRLDPTLAPNITVRHFGGGHMFYTWEASRVAFRDCLAKFYADALAPA